MASQIDVFHDCFDQVGDPRVAGRTIALRGNPVWSPENVSQAKRSRSSVSVPSVARSHCNSPRSVYHGCS
nr:hypothetical protein [Rhodopirellula sp. SM50]